MADFAHPGRLWLLLLLVPGSLWVVRGGRMRLRAWKALAQDGRPSRDGAWWRVAAVSLVILALAQPRWGRLTGPSAMSGRDVVLLIDVSRSMAAEDAVPDRLGVACASATSLLRAMAEEPGDRVAVVAFAGRGVVRCPLTFQKEAAIETVAGLRAGDVQPGGSDLGTAIDAAIAAFAREDQAGGRSIVVFSDGEDLAQSADAGAEHAREAGIVVHAVAIGDPKQSHPIPDGPSGTPLTYQGRPIATRRSDAPLELLARATGGSKIDLDLMPADLGPLYRGRIARETGHATGHARPSPHPERFPGFLLAALACLLIGSRPGRVGRRLRTLVPAIALCVMATGADDVRETAATLVGRGRAEYQAGRFAEAIEAFEQAGRLGPSSPIPPYDAATALYQLGRYPEAIDAYRKSSPMAGPRLRLKIDYGLGNALLASGDLPGALTAYDACLASNWPGPEADAVRGDAAANRAFAISRQVRPPSTADEDGTGPRPPTKSGKSDREGRGRNQAGGPAPNQAGEAPDSPGSRGQGGQGGQGVAPPGAETPGSRLDEALREVRNARRLRPADVRAERSTSPDVRDW
ncbi:vWA domain-containing protein [Tundrisphaera sp. TA3]|uniref:vWA domain-containing protein n=1 Tax=Tundrisphaera sp. TA3 TaxID=3435775 RepID=UPI003EBA57E0